MRNHDGIQTSLLRKAAEDPLLGQHDAPPPPVIVDNEEEYEVDDVLDTKQAGVTLEKSGFE